MSIEYGVADTVVLILEIAVGSVAPRNETPDLGTVAVDQEPVLKKFRGRAVEHDLFRNLQPLMPTNRNMPTNESQPREWWQIVGS